MSKHFLIREAMPSDNNFVMNSWLRSVQEDSRMNKSLFYSSYTSHIESLRKNAKITVASDLKDPGFVHGYIVHQTVDDVFLLHWAYVKAPFRRLGIMSDLIRHHFPELKSEPLVITYKNDKRARMYESLKCIYRPDFRSVKV